MPVSFHPRRLAVELNITTTTEYHNRLEKASAIVSFWPISNGNGKKSVWKSSLKSLTIYNISSPKHILTTTVIIVTIPSNIRQRRKYQGYEQGETT